ncbi:unnamed protein product [Adineta ricciae]|uniref:Rab-GAP TBC domain-containing protein n=1 Tax=Adineta ricciae TaxID=249248 RepID=A0A814R646_ADIRI|nr:unnamed protein product [Adineta ricciae]
MGTIDEYHYLDGNSSDSDHDSAVMEDAHSELISSSITTNGSLSLSDDENFLVVTKTKCDRIEKYLVKNNIEKLQKYAKMNGLISESYRQQIWPLLIHFPTYCPVEFDQVNRKYSCPIDYYAADKNQIESHRYYGQVRMDVERTLKRFPPNYSESDRIELQEELIVIIVKMLIKHDYLNYYQGYHDICLSFLLVLGADLCLPFIDTITKSHFKDFMEPTMKKTCDLLSYLMPLINCINSECAEYMQRGGVGNVMFALSWFITWYSHVLDNLDTVLRLYDLFIVSHFLMPIYVAAEVVNFHSKQVLSTDCDMASLHPYLTRLPSDLSVSHWEEIIKRSLQLFRNHHPDTLDVLNDEWRRKCESIDNPSMETILRRRYGTDSSPTDNHEEKTLDNIDQNEQSAPLPRIVLWGVTLTISGLAIYIWNHTQRTDPTTFISLGDFLAQLLDLMDANNHSNDMVGENPSVDVGDNPTENEPIRNVQETEATETVPCEPLTSEDEIKIANLTTTVASQSSEIAELNARLVACQQHYETVLARQKDDYSREKQSTVMRYAQAEKAKLDSDKRCDTLLAKNADLTKEKENLQMKLSEFKLMNTKLQQAYDNKAAELNTTRKELEKVKELNQSIDATLKSTLNHLKGESQQLREQRELNERLKRDLNEQHEMNEQLKSQCKQLTETVQAVPTDDERTQAFDTLLNEHNSLKSQLAIVQEENNRFLEKLKSATEDHVALENVIENFRLNAVRDKETNKKLYDDLLAAREQDAIEISRLKQIENLHNQTLADNADLRQLLEKEHQHLELTQKLTEKNSVLQSNYEQLEIIHKKISEHHDSLKKINEEQHSRITQLESTETSLRDQLKDLEEKYGNLSKSHEEIVKKYDDSLIEIQTLKKKHQANTKDLIKQLQQLQKTKATAHDDGSSPALQTR